MPVDKIRAPYGFVPLSPTVSSPEWANIATQDWPLEDGLCGHIDVEIEAKSPIFVRGVKGDKDTSFFRDPSDQVGIPGSSLRGLLRNTLEIATFAKFNRFNDHRYGVRDLQNRALYGDHMATILTVAGSDKKEPMPLVNAGWLTKVEGEDGVAARIEVCDFAKLEYGLLGEIAAALKIKNFNPGLRQSAVDKYRRWSVDGNTTAKLTPKLAVRKVRNNGADARLVSVYGRVTGGGKLPGTIVFTGQPSQYNPNDLNRRPSAGNPKHHDFFFFDVAEGQKRHFDVSADAFRDFEFIHSDGGEQHRLTGRLKPNTEWGHWVGGFERGERVPVFFLVEPDGQRLRAFGLAMMFRLAYRHTIKDIVKAQQSAFESQKLDFVETLFGRVPDRREGTHAGDSGDRTETLRGRVSVGFARAERYAEDREVRVVLGTPKASYYPNYIEQNPAAGFGRPPATGKGGFVWKTLMDKGAQVRGWKRYRPIVAHEVIRPPDPTRGDGGAMNLDKVATVFKPLKAGATFKARIRLHNVKPEEVGALLWALDFGGTPDTYHKLGLARPLGYGTVQLRVRGHDLRPNAGGPAPALADCVTKFTGWINKQAPGWANTPQIKELIALAKPMPLEDARHMQIKHPANRNEFTEAKKAGLALGSASR